MEGTRYFQFIAGERKGEVVIFDRIETDDDMVFVCFKDNSRCNEELILEINSKEWNGKLMAEVSDSKNIWKFKEEWKGRQEEKRSDADQSEDGSTTYIIQPFVEGRKVTIPVPPKKVNVQSNFGHITNHIEPAVLPEAKSKPTHTGDPVYLMLDKSKKVDTEISLDMTVSLPKQSLYSVVDDSFEDGGIKMIQYIIDEMDLDIIKKALKKSLLEAYKENDDKYIDNGHNIGIVKQHNTSIDPTQIYEGDIVEEAIVSEAVIATKEEIETIVQKRIS